MSKYQVLTTNFGTDEEKPHMRLYESDEQAHHCDVPKSGLPGSIHAVDAAGIEGRIKLLPGEGSVITS